jgi:hypothetical protein
VTARTTTSATSATPSSSTKNSTATTSTPYRVDGSQRRIRDDRNGKRESSSSSGRKDGDKASSSSSASLEDSKARRVRYFMIKSFNYEHLDISVDKSVWSTQEHNERKLNDAFEASLFYRTS